MMKRTLLSLMITVLLASVCYPEILMTGIPLGQDNMSIQLFDSATLIKVANANVSVYGPRFIYGVNNDLDVFVGIGSSTNNITDSTTGSTLIDLGGKYTFNRMSHDIPFDLAAILRYDTNSGKDITWGKTSIGVIASKLLRTNFTVYGALVGTMNYAKFTGSKSMSSNDIEWGLGAKYQMNTNLSFLSELMMYTMSGDFHSTFSVAAQYDF